MTLRATTRRTATVTRTKEALVGQAGQEARGTPRFQWGPRGLLRTRESRTQNKTKTRRREARRRRRKGQRRRTRVTKDRNQRERNTNPTRTKSTTPRIVCSCCRHDGSYFENILALLFVINRTTCTLPLLLLCRYLKDCIRTVITHTPLFTPVHPCHVLLAARYASTARTASNAFSANNNPSRDFFFIALRLTLPGVSLFASFLSFSLSTTTSSGNTFRNVGFLALNPWLNWARLFRSDDELLTDPVVCVDS